MSKYFDQLFESVQQMDEIVRGERAPSREVTVSGADVKAVRNRTGLSQVKFAKLIEVEPSTLRNWEQGRREPTGPARALLKALSNSPKSVVQALRGPAGRQKQRA